MAELQSTAEYEAVEAAEVDAAEQVPPVDEEPVELPFEADPADAVEQAVAVPVDEDEYR